MSQNITSVQHYFKKHNASEQCLEMEPRARASFCMLIKEAYTKANCIKIYQQGFKNHLCNEDGHICQVFGDCGTGRNKGVKNKPDIWLTSK